MVSMEQLGYLWGLWDKVDFRRFKLVPPLQYILLIKPFRVTTRLALLFIPLFLSLIFLELGCHEAIDQLLLLYCLRVLIDITASSPRDKSPPLIFIKENPSPLQEQSHIFVAQTIFLIEKTQSLVDIPAPILAECDFPLFQLTVKLSLLPQDIQSLEQSLPLHSIPELIIGGTQFGFSVPVACQQNLFLTALDYNPSETRQLMVILFKSQSNQRFIPAHHHQLPHILLLRVRVLATLPI